MQWKKDDVTLKLLALIFALILWLYVGIEKNPVVEHTIQVPVSIINLAEDKTATLSSDTIRLTVRGRETKLSAVNEQDFRAVLDLKNKDVGEHQVDVKINGPSMIKITKLDPEQVSVHIEQREGMRMKVSILRSGTLPEGVTLKNLSVDPGEVFVSGNLNMLSQISSVGVAVDLSQLTENVDKEVPVVFFDKDGTRIEAEEIKAYPSRIHLQATVEQNVIEKELPIQAQLTGSLPAGYELTAVDVTPTMATVSGTPDELSKILTVKTEKIDISSLTESTTKTVNLMGKHLSQPMAVQVTLTINKGNKNTVERTMTKMVPVQLQGKAAGNFQLETSIVQVTYHMEEGYKDAGDKLSAFVNVDKITDFSMMERVQLMNIEGLTVENISPSSVQLISKS